MSKLGVKIYDMEIVYQQEQKLDYMEFLEVLRNSTLAERRPVNNIEKIKGMCENADLIITARLEGKLVGVARSITDRVYCTYLSDLAVDVKIQKAGVGKKLLELTQLAYPETVLILLSAPKAVGFYEKTWMTKHPAAFYHLPE